MISEQFVQDVKMKSFNFLEYDLYIICLLQIKFKIIKLQGGSFLIDYFPVKLVATDFILVAGTAAAIALLASLVPAIKASRQSIELK